MNPPLVMCIQCTDRQSGRIGTFISEEGKKEALSPVFDSTLGLLDWMRQNGYRCDDSRVLGVSSAPVQV